MFNFNEYINNNIFSSSMDDFSKKLKESLNNNSFADMAMQGMENSAHIMQAFAKNLSETIAQNSESMKKYTEHAMKDFQALMASKNQEEMISNNQKIFSNMTNNSSEMVKEYLKNSSQIAIKNFEEFNNFFKNKNHNKNEQNAQEKNKQK